jgi:hypothetical protein
MEISRWIALHCSNPRATPEMFRNYKLALLLYKTINEEILEEDRLSLNFNQILTNRQSKFGINKTNRLLVGMNTLHNRFHKLNGKIPLDWFNKGELSFKVHCKKQFITQNVQNWTMPIV